MPTRKLYWKAEAAIEKTYSGWRRTHTGKNKADHPCRCQKRCGVLHFEGNEKTFEPYLSYKGK